MDCDMRLATAHEHACNYVLNLARIFPEARVCVKATGRFCVDAGSNSGIRGRC